MTRKVIYQRQRVIIDRWRGHMEAPVALEIKGLKANMMQLRGIVSSLTSNSASAIATGSKLQQQVAELQKEFEQHSSDIEFAAGIMGNSPPQSEEPSTESPSSPAVEPPTQSFQAAAT